MAGADTEATITREQIEALEGVEVGAESITVQLLHPLGARTPGQAKMMPQTDPDAITLRAQILARDLWTIEGGNSSRVVAQLAVSLSDAPDWIVGRLDLQDWLRLEAVINWLLQGKAGGSAATELHAAG